MRGGRARSALLFSLAASFCSFVEAQEPTLPARESDPDKQLQWLQVSRERGVIGEFEYEEELKEVERRWGLDWEPYTPPPGNDAFDEFARRAEKLDSLSSFQTPSRLSELRPQAEQHQRIIEELESNLSARYRLLDVSGRVLFRGDDLDELAMKSRDALSDGARHSLFVEMKEYSQAKADAVLSMLRIRQHLIDPTVFIEVLPHFEENLAPRLNLFSRGIRLEALETPVERIDAGADAGKFAKSVPFSSGFGARHFAVRLVCATRELLLEVVEIIKKLLGAGVYRDDQSLSQLVEAARTEMMKRHPGLTNEQFRIDTVGQFGWIGMSQMLRTTLFAWS